MTSKQSKRAAFAHRQRVKRIHDRIIKANRSKRGFVGVISNLSINGETIAGFGAAFIGWHKGA